jgi:hypothetical protein
MSLGNEAAEDGVSDGGVGDVLVHCKLNFRIFRNGKITRYTDG